MDTISENSQSQNNILDGLEFNLDETRRFLDIVCEGFTPTFQIFHDRNKNEKAAHFTDDFDAVSQRLIKANQAGYGAFFMVNEGDGKGRKGKNILNITTVFIDLDDKSDLCTKLDRIRAFPLEPLAITESSPNKVHAYWSVEGCSIDFFTPLQKKLAKHFGGDPNIHDPSRIMRLPGLYHLKGKPFLVRIVELNERQPYQVGDILKELDCDASDEDYIEPINDIDPDSFEGSIPEGARNNTLFHWARYYFTRGYSSDKVLELIEKKNTLQCKPPLKVKELKSIVGSAPKYVNEKNTDDWSSFVPLEIELGEQREFPVQSLPTIIKDAVIEYQAFGKQPMSIVVCSALTTCSLACQALADVERDEELKSPLSLYFNVIAESGERKSAADQAFSKAIRIWEQTELEAIKPDLAQHKVQMKIWEAQNESSKKEISATVKKDPLTNIEEKLLKLEEEKPVAPIIPRLLYEQTTSEAFIQDLATGWPSAGLCSDEGGLIVGSHSMGKDKALQFMALLNRLWDGGRQTRSDTKNNGRYNIIGRRVTFSLMMQECVLNTLLESNNGTARGTGFLARSFITYPKSTIGQRLYTPPGVMRAMERFKGRILDILYLEITVDENGGVIPKSLQLSKEAKERWIQYANEIERESGSKGKYSKVKDFASKNPENVARLAGVFHIICHGLSSLIIDEKIMIDAIVIGQWMLDEAARIFEIFAVPEEIADAKVLLDWILTESQSLDRRRISQYGPARVRSRKRRDGAINILLQHGMIKRQGKNLLIVHPELFNDFVAKVAV